MNNNTHLLTRRRSSHSLVPLGACARGDPALERLVHVAPLLQGDSKRWSGFFYSVGTGPGVCSPSSRKSPCPCGGRRYVAPAREWGGDARRGEAASARGARCSLFPGARPELSDMGNCRAFACAPGGTTHQVIDNWRTRASTHDCASRPACRNGGGGGVRRGETRRLIQYASRRCVRTTAPATHATALATLQAFKRFVPETRRVENERLLHTFGP